MAVGLEDLYEDILAKAQKGLSLSDTDVCERTGIDPEVWKEQKNGGFAEEAARKAAPVLNLNAEALIRMGRGEYAPEPVEIDGLAAFNTPFPLPSYPEMRVNAFAVWDPATKAAVVFDTGADSSAMLEKIEEEGLSVEMILLTHAQRDHIHDLDRLRRATGNPPTYANRAEPVPGTETIKEGWRSTVGGLDLEARLTNGHSPGGTSYVVTGLARPVCIVGDSIFAGSQGGAAGAWQLALENNEHKILSLPQDTILCPGHGPVTTVAEERRNNPYFANKWA